MEELTPVRETRVVLFSVRLDRDGKTLFTVFFIVLIENEKRIILSMGEKKILRERITRILKILPMPGSIIYNI